MPSLFSTQLNQKRMMPQNVQCETFSIENANLIGEEPESKAIEGDDRKHAVYLYPDHSFNCVLTNGKELGSIRLSSHQVSLLLSSIWIQATSMENGPENFEAMAHTYSIALLFACSKTSNYMALVRCFQLAFSTKSLSLDQGLQPSQRRSLFTLGTYMLIISARAGNFPDLVPIVKASMTEATLDPFLELVDDIRLQAVYLESEKIVYGSLADQVAAMESLSAVELDDKKLKEIVTSNLMTKFANLSEDEVFCLKKQLAESFLPDEAYPRGARLFMETPGPCFPVAEIEFQDFDAMMTTPVASTDEESEPESSRIHSDHKASVSSNYPDVKSVAQLLESVSEIAKQIADLPISSTPVPYDQIKNQCEALAMGTNQKMSVLHSFKHKKETWAINLDRFEQVC
ncbi:hypothetical protein QN277_007940 [Acacia crassicarpa]|uniref:Uncharacterized protein n=1 Tax=Acacia crassicarpa TaxID=499986 RepID=A0AAE1M9W2_9FABA|nr:hypothetical protein QN277_007940 [Acacia crassicarpa]